MTGIFILAAAAAALSVSADATTVAVFEVGKGGTIRRTTATSPTTSVSSVASFWSASHDTKQRRRRATQHPGMTIVPDLFNRADGGIVVGLVGSGVDLASMPTVANYMEGAVGHFHVPGNEGMALMEKASCLEAVDSKNFGSLMSQKVKAAVSTGNNKLESLTVSVDSDKAAAEVDAALSEMIRKIEDSLESGSTIVVHLVVDEESGAARRRLMSRVLEGDDENEENQEDNQDQENQEDNQDQENQEDNQDNQEDQNNEEENQDQQGEEDQQADQEDQQAQDQDQEAEEDQEQDGNNNGGNANAANYNANYKTRGYINSYGEWVTIEKTVFQIQYFNVVLWSSIGLTVILFFTLGLMIDMPLMPDSLLFGESAKMMGD